MRIVKDMVRLLRLWLFLRFVDKQELKLHENMRKPHNQGYRNNIVVGEVNMDNAVVAYAHGRPLHRLFLKTSAAKVEKLCVDSIGYRFFVPTKDKRPHRSWLVMTHKGRVFSMSLFGYFEELYNLYPKVTFTIVSGGAFVFFYGLYHFFRG